MNSGSWKYASAKLIVSIPSSVKHSSRRAGLITNHQTLAAASTKPTPRNDQIAILIASGGWSGPAGTGLKFGPVIHSVQITAWKIRITAPANAQSLTGALCGAAAARTPASGCLGRCAVTATPNAYSPTAFSEARSSICAAVRSIIGRLISSGWYFGCSRARPIV